MKFPSLLVSGAIAILLPIKASSTVIVGDLSNSFGALSSLPADYGWAQQITIGSGVWSLTSASVYIGNQVPAFPAVPVVQIRNAAPGNIPGSTVLGSFTMNPADIPSYEFGVNHLGPVSAPADSTILLGPGTYWLCMMNLAAAGSGDTINIGFDTALPIQSGPAGNTVNDATMATWNGTDFSSYTPGTAHQNLLVELDGTAVPEPSVSSLSAAGAVITLLLPRRAYKD